MQLKLGNKIRELRLRDGRTQDALANAIGVTAQAISRWESGGGYPDMELVPSIANFFGVSIDALFGYECEREQKLDMLLDTIKKKNKQNNGKNICVDECIALARSGLMEFPGNERLMLCLATLLCNAGYVKYGEHHLTDKDGFDIYDTERHKTYAEWQEAIALYEKLFSSFSDGEMRRQATIELLQLYLNIGSHEKAKQVAQAAPTMDACREMLLLCACDGQERAKAYDEALSDALSLCATLMVSQINAYRDHYYPSISAEKLTQAIALYDLMENKEQYTGKLVCLYLYRSYFLWKEGKRDECFADLEKARILSEKCDAIHGNQDASRLTAVLPEAWPWWAVSDHQAVFGELSCDDRFRVWAEKCKTGSVN